MVQLPHVSAKETGEVSETNPPPAKFAVGETVRLGGKPREVISVQWQGQFWVYKCRERDDPKAPILSCPECLLKPDSPPPMGRAIVSGRPR
jgi:hypothetical protein